VCRKKKKIEEIDEERVYIDARLPDLQELVVWQTTLGPAASPVNGVCMPTRSCAL
jgi:hypothetical protein